MGFFERFSKQERDSERRWREYQEGEKRKVNERAIQRRKDFEEWHARDLLPVWRNWERLQVTRKLEATKKRFPDQRFSLVILKTGVSTTPNAGSYYKEFSWGSADANQGHIRSQSRPFRSDDFTQDKVLVATSGAPTSLRFEAESEGDYYSYIAVFANKDTIFVSGSDGITLNSGVSVREFDNALLGAIAKPGGGRRHDPDR